MMIDSYTNLAQTDISRRMVATEYNLDYSTYVQHMSSYPLSFNYGNYGFSSQPDAYQSFNAIGSNGAQQSLFVPGAYTDPRCVPQIHPAKSVTTQSSDSPVVKAEDISPVDRNREVFDVSPQELQSPSSSETTFSTDVDTLMRAIQHTSRNHSPRQAKVATDQYHGRSFVYGPEQRTRDRGNRFEHTGFRTRKKYQCHVPSCAKVFFQKTHLEIHVRAHTGQKPFVRIASTCLGPWLTVSF